MKITKRQLQKIIREEIVGPTAVSMTGPVRESEIEVPADMKSREAAAYAVKKVGYPMGAEIENEIHYYLEDTYGMNPNGDDIWPVADKALQIAGEILGVGDTL